MTVRLFTAADSDDIRTGLGGLASMVFGTFAATVRPADTDSTTKTILRLHDASGGGNHVGLAVRAGRLRLTNGTATSETGNVVSGNWMTLIARMGLSSALPRFSIWDHGFDDWTHVDGGSAISGASQGAGAGGTARFSVAGSDHFDGLIAARAAWSNSLPWSPDSSGDSAIEGAGLEAGLQNWADALPSALWALHQDDTSDDLIDLTGNGADQTGISGTTVVAGDDPPGFTPDLLDLVAAGTGTGSLSASIFDPNLATTGILRGDGAPLRAWQLTQTGLTETTP